MARGKLTGQSVAMAFVTGGLQGVSNLEARHNETISENVFKKAISEVRDNGGDPSPLEDLRQERFPSANGQPGRKSVQIGETRTYKVSEAGTLSLSAKAWGLSPGQEVTVQYGANGVTIVG